VHAEVGAMVKAQDEYLASHTVLETLLYMNAEEKVAGTSASTTARRTSASRATGRGRPRRDWFGGTCDLRERRAARLLPERAHPRHLRRRPPGLAAPGVANDPTLRLRTLGELSGSRRRRPPQPVYGRAATASSAWYRARSVSGSTTGMTSRRILL